ncbi:MAG: hypothetical protein NZL83_04585 [Candidatus Absconditabacterales bacterium]|nr:hypothetical protein [Candidatus Absconditabacterales bacterium]
MSSFLILEPSPAIQKDWISLIGFPESYDIFYAGEKNVDIDSVVGVVVRSGITVNRELIDTYPSLRYICRVGVGIENIDTIYAKEKNIAVINTPGANANAVADLVLLGILYLQRKMYICERSYEKRFSYLGHELSTQTVGILGFGNIGKKIYQRLLAFGVTNFLIYDPYLSSDIVSSFQYCNKKNTIEEVFGKSNIISLHLPLTPETRLLIHADVLSLTKNDLCLINTSRGGIVDEDALYSFLCKNRDASAFFDVREEEPNLGPKISQLLTLPNFLLTPHIGAMTHEANKNMHIFTCPS